MISLFLIFSILFSSLHADEPLEVSTTETTIGGSVTSVFSGLGIQGYENDFGFIDLGLLPGRVDAMDFIIDFSKSCDSDDLFINGGGKRATFDQIQKLNISLGQMEKASGIVQGMGFKLGSDPSIVDDHFVVPKYANKGSNVTFILLPEGHPSMVPDHLKAKNATIDFKRTIFAIQRIQNQSDGHVILNLKEGLEGHSPLVPGFVSKNDPYEDAWELVTHNTYFSLANMYDSNKVFSATLESPFLWALDAMTRLGNFHPEMTFPKVISNMEAWVGEIPKESQALFEETFKRISQWTPQRLAKAKSTVCEDRSKRMAQKAIEHVNRKNATLVFLTFGMSHSKGIIEEIERSGFNYVMLIGNSKPLIN